MAHSQRLGHVAGLAVFLASPAADYITGQVFHVNGDMLMP
jgi:NAD(P)-dependent dehydrogenase (short-subunit alcohol dehydrogenase family)